MVYYAIYGTLKKKISLFMKKARAHLLKIIKRFSIKQEERTQVNYSGDKNHVSYS
jgi:hypothetical protein